MKNSTENVWFVTGASKGLGLSLVKRLLNEGYKVAATSRSLKDLENAVGNHTNFLPLTVDLLNEQSVADAVSKTINKFGSLDIVVNNAGYGMVGALEELSDAESRQNFDVNVFGSLNVIRQAMPYLRKRQSGHIFNISSVAGFTGGFPGFGIYCATKFAVTGFTESLAIEAKPFGVKVTLVLPGYFRTNFLESDSLAVPRNQMEEYSDVRAIQTAHQDEIRGNQPGDPEKGVAAIIQAADAPNPPLYLFLGSDSLQFSRQKIDMVENEIDTWKEVTASTDF